MKKILYALLIISAQACGTSKYYFSANDSLPATTPTTTPGTVATPAPTCTPGVATLADLRILFMIDNSSSTTDTDPNYAVRKVSIDNFLTTYGSKTNFTYSFSYFGGTTASGYDANSAGFVGFGDRGSLPTGSYFGSSTMLGSALNSYLNVGISGDTPYGAAFDALDNLIASDATTSSNHYLYAVIFMSDGQPTDVNSSQNPGSSNDPMVGFAQGVVGSAKSVAMSTVYFGPEPQDPTNLNDTNAIAMANLKTLASVGGGGFVDSNKTTQIVISDLITVPGGGCSQ
jgi:hypothetical protein